MIGAAAERARHEDEVRDSEARFRELADTTPALMWMTDAEGDVTFVNEGWLRFTGRELQRRSGRHVRRRARTPTTATTCSSAGATRSPAAPSSASSTA